MLPTQSLVSFHYHLFDPLYPIYVIPFLSGNHCSIVCIYDFAFLAQLLFLFYIPHMSEKIWFCPFPSDFFHLA